MSERPLFFSGGTALRPLSRLLAARKFPSSHIISTFDSGGSTAALRKAFAIPAVGDLRNRLLALADLEQASPAALAFCDSRLPKDISFQEARARLAGLASSRAGWEGIPPEYEKAMRGQLSRFLEQAPPDFDARGASIGNILLTASYLENKRDFGGALAFFSALFHICGAIAPVVDSSLHLGAKLRNGQILIGQHLFSHLPAPIERIFLTVHEPRGKVYGTPTPCRPPMNAAARELVGQAGLICYPMGSFHSSLLVNLIPEGVGKAIAASSALKVFIPNSGVDPERGELRLAEQAARILDALREDAPEARIGDLLNLILIDSEHGQYPGMLESSLGSLGDMGIKIVARPMIRPGQPQRHEPEALFMALREIMANGGGAA